MVNPVVGIYCLTLEIFFHSIFLIFFITLNLFITYIICYIIIFLYSLPFSLVICKKKTYNLFPLHKFYPCLSMPMFLFCHIYPKC